MRETQYAAVLVCVNVEPAINLTDPIPRLNINQRLCIDFQNNQDVMSMASWKLSQLIPNPYAHTIN